MRSAFFPTLGPAESRSRAKLRASTLIVLLTLAFGGCSDGGDYAVTVTWLINGTAPSADLCRANGVDRIRFTVLSPGHERSLESDCDASVTLDDGYDYGGFDSTHSFDYDVEYQYRVEMLDKSGRPLEDVSYTDSFKVQYGDYVPWVLDPLELFAPDGDLAGLSGEWTIGGQKASADLCAQLGATTVVIDFASSTDLDFVDYLEFAAADCSQGVVFSDGAVLAEGEYNVRYVALDADDQVVQEVMAEQLYVVDAPGTLDIETIDFALPK